MEFFDSNAFIGLPNTVRTQQASYGDLIAAMDKAGIGRALVWHIAQHDCAPDTGNSLLGDALPISDRLVGCWTILPPQMGEVITPDFFDRMKTSGIVALRAFPVSHNFLLNRTVFGGFLDEVAERRIPVLLSLDFGGSWPVVYQILQDYPSLTCILCDVGIWNQDRYLWPLLERYENVRAETSMVSLQAGGVEATVKKFGAGRLVFGTGFPNRYPEAAILDLLNLTVPEADRLAIASGNLTRMLSEVTL